MKENQERVGPEEGAPGRRERAPVLSADHGPRKMRVEIPLNLAGRSLVAEVRRGGAGIASIDLSPEEAYWKERRNRQWLRFMPLRLFIQKYESRRCYKLRIYVASGET